MSGLRAPVPRIRGYLAVSSGCESGVSFVDLDDRVRDPLHEAGNAAKAGLHVGFEGAGTENQRVLGRQLGL